MTSARRPPLKPSAATAAAARETRHSLKRYEVLEEIAAIADLRVARNSRTGCLRSERCWCPRASRSPRSSCRAVDERLTVDHDGAGFRLTFATGDNTGKNRGGDRVTTECNGRRGPLSRAPAHGWCPAWPADGTPERSERRTTPETSASSPVRRGLAELSCDRTGRCRSRPVRLMRRVGGGCAGCVGLGC